MTIQKTVKLQICKELTADQQKSVIKLKGYLISHCCTEIIHIQDLDQEHHINSFDTSAELQETVLVFIHSFISQNNLTHVVFLKS